MTGLRIAGAGTLALLAGCAGAADGESVDVDRVPPKITQVIDGAASPEELGFAIDRFERNAAAGQLNSSVLGALPSCSGTLIGDRVVVTAGHCVVANQAGWVTAGESPMMLLPSTLRYAIGDNVTAPLWLATVESVHLHPDAEPRPDLQEIHHDAALVILAESAWDSCPEVVPAQINRQAVDPALVGELGLLGGFGSLGGSSPPSAQRYWALLEISDVDERHVTVRDLDQGFPSYGDSGGGLLFRYADGSLRNLGMVSTGVGSEMRLVRLDAQTAWIDSVVDPALLCGPVDERGTCRDDVAARCTSEGFWSVDCRQSGLVCVEPNEAEPARCGCPCDDGPACRADCACDPDCPCDCDTSAECDGGCACDPQCAEDEDADDEGGCSVAGAHPSASTLPFFAGMLFVAFAARRQRRRA